MDDKLFILLAKTDTLAQSFKLGLKDYVKFFKGSQPAFRGEQKIYMPKDDSVDDPNRRGVTMIQTTVNEKLDWFVDSNKEYINCLFAQEATNASGNATAELIVEGDNWGQFSSLELLRFKSILENGDFKNMYVTIPVRSDSEQWRETTNDLYSDRRGVFEQPLVIQENRTTIKESYILPDPNIDKATTKNYTPQIAQKHNTIVLGEGSVQKFTGEWSQRQRANAQRKISILHVAVVEALKRANDCEVVKSDLTSEKIFNYIHGE